MYLYHNTDWNWVIESLQNYILDGRIKSLVFLEYLWANFHVTNFISNLLHLYLLLLSSSTFILITKRLWYDGKIALKIIGLPQSFSLQDYPNQVSKAIIYHNLLPYFERKYTLLPKFEEVILDHIFLSIRHHLRVDSIAVKNVYIKRQCGIGCEGDTLPETNIWCIAVVLLYDFVDYTHKLIYIYTN